MGFDDICNTGLVLGLGFAPAIDSPPPASAPAENKRIESTVSPKFDQLITEKSAVGFGPSLTLGLSAGDDQAVKKIDNQSVNLYRQDSTGASSFSNGSVKRERELGNEDYLETTERVLSSRASDEEDDGLNPKKKLRLTKDQSALLEESFKIHSTLNPKQKQELARKLNLRARQVEVWFQNRRARTKLKQTEVDLEFLKKCCETLTDENRRLQKELQELKALKLAQPFYMQLPAATLTMCPSCERVAGSGGGGGGGGDNKAPKSAFTVATKSPHMYNPFTNQSAAC